ncbi:MAG TPA: NUDIX domain-containing protein [Cyclobacteriaceae bacterium]|nr:NUDIX domain-containing protein [Cyclobacteriaceae bacterium]
MEKYSHQQRYLIAVDSIIFGFDGKELKLLLIHRGFEPEIGKWSLMGGFVESKESLEMAAARILKKLTGLSGVFMEQLFTFGNPERDPVERTVSVAYYALIDIHQYEKQLSQNYHPEWVPVKEIPNLIFDHQNMVAIAKARLRDKSTTHPILFELLPEKFTLPVLQNLYESVFEKEFDKRNFSRKILSSGLLVKTKDKEKTGSKKGAFYYKLDKRKYRTQFGSFLNFIPSQTT